MERISTAAERRLLLEYRDALDEIRGIMAKLYEKFGTDDGLTMAEMNRYGRMAELERQIAKILGPVFKSTDRMTTSMTRTMAEQGMYRTQWAIDQASGVATKWGLMSKTAIAAAVENPGWRKLHEIAIQNAKETTLRAIDRNITQGLIRGDSYSKMARAIKSAFDGAATDAVRIARTEGQRAQVIGQQAAYEAAEEKGVEVVQVWDATLDDRTRPEHGALDGVERKEDGWFVPSIGWVEGPLQSGVPSFDINCRCRVRGQIKGYAPKVRRIRDEGVKPYTTFSAWAKERGLTKNVYGQSLE